MKDNKERKEESVRLMRWGLNTFKNITLFEQKVILGQADVCLGQKDKVDLIAGAPVSYVVSKVLSDDVKVEISYKTPLKAPIKNGEKVGFVSVNLPDGNKIEVPLITAKSVEEMGLFMRTIVKARLLTTGMGKFK